MPVKVATLIVEDEPDAVARAAGGLFELGITWEQVHRVPSEAGVQHWQVAIVEASVVGDSVAQVDRAADSLAQAPQPDDSTASVHHSDSSPSKGDADSTVIKAAKLSAGVSATISNGATATLVGENANDARDLSHSPHESPDNVRRVVAPEDKFANNGVHAGDVTYDDAQQGTRNGLSSSTTGDASNDSSSYHSSEKSIADTDNKSTSHQDDSCRLSGRELSADHAAPYRQLFRLPGVLGLLEESDLSPRRGYLNSAEWSTRRVLPSGEQESDPQSASESDDIASEDVSVRPDAAASRDGAEQSPEGEVKRTWSKIGQGGENAGVNTRRRDSSHYSLSAQDLIPPLVEHFPAIERQVASLEKTTRSFPDRNALYRDIGVRTGRCLAVDHPRIHQVETIGQGLECTIVGLLFPIARGVVENDQFRVFFSPFLKVNASGLSGMRHRLFSQHRVRVEFIAGLINGVLNHGEKLPNIEVDYESTRHQGLQQWTFSVRAI